MAHRIFSLVAVFALCVALASCGGSEAPNRPKYTPITDEELFAQIATIPEVSEVDIDYQDTFENGKGYVGEITVDAVADVPAVLDHAVAILRQGRWQVDISVVAVQDRRQVSTDVLGLESPIEPYLTERYGLQPGNGLPPESPTTP